MAKQRPRLVTRWESLEGGVQAAIAMPILSVVLFFVHLGPLNQPWTRSVGYGIFWAIPATAAVVAATAHERRKRLEQDAGTPAESDLDGAP